jgi:predicted dehydrogenase
MPPERLRTAIVGCGRIGTRTRPELAAVLPPGWLPLSHADAIRSVPGLDLAALCDTSPENLKRAAEAFGIRRTYADARALLKELRPEILSIATRTPGRCDLIVDACRNGVKGMHVEKPISTNLQDCERALQAAADGRVALSYGTTRRYMEIYIQARDLLRNGEIGDLLEVQIQMGRTTLLWNHPHSIDLMLFFSGARDVEAVEARCAIRDGAADSNQVDDDPVVESASVRFSNGVLGVIGTVEGSDVVLAGTRGTLRVVGDGARIDLPTRKIDALPGTSGTARAFMSLESCIRDGAAPPISPGDILLGQKILLGIALSGLRGGTRTPLSELNPGFTVTGRSGSLTA